MILSFSSIEWRYSNETNMEIISVGTNFGSIKDQVGQWKPPEWLTRKNESLRNSRWAKNTRKENSGWLISSKLRSKERERERDKEEKSIRSHQNWVELQSSRALTYTVGQGLLSADLSFFFTNALPLFPFLLSTNAIFYIPPLYPFDPPFINNTTLPNFNPPPRFRPIIKISRTEFRSAR